MPIRALELFCGRAWAIHPDWLEPLKEIAGRERFPSSEELAAIKEGREKREALAAQVGSRLDNAPLVRVRDGVGVLSIFGPLVPRADYFDAISGAEDVAQLARNFNGAIADPSVKAILLHIDSPGGDVTDIGEFAGMVFGARDQKPITAYVSGYGTSAAYWIAAGAEEIVASNSALLGSIGVYAAYRDTRARDEKNGITKVEFVSNQSPNKRPDPQTESGKAQIQEQVDALASEMIRSIAEMRGISEEQVVSKYGGGGVKVGKSAVDAGLADRLGTFEGTLADLVKRTRKAPNPGGKAAGSAAMSGREGEAMSSRVESFLAWLKGEGGEEPKVEEQGSLPKPAGASPEQLREEREKREAAEARSAKMLADLKPEIIRAGIRAGHPAKLVEQSVNALAAAGDWDGLNQYWADAKEAASAIKPGTSAIREKATEEPTEENSERRQSLTARAKARGAKELATYNGRRGDE